MTAEFCNFKRDLDAAFFNYAHITGAVELYMQVLEVPALQRALSKTLTDQESQWNSIHRFMRLDNQNVEWYPSLPVQVVTQQKNDFIGLLYGIFISRMIGSVEYYFSSVLKNRFAHTEKSGSSWSTFSQKAKIDLLDCKNGSVVYLLLQERHKIEHNKAQIDQTFVDRMMKDGITHSYTVGDSIQKSHLDILAAHTAIREFISHVDSLLI